MISIKSEDIESIYLLSIQQAERLPKYILAIGDSWWLRSPGTFCGAVEVDENGNVNYFGLKVDYNRGGVRPALKIKNLDLLNLEIGETVKVFELLAQYIGDNSVLLCESITNHRFDSKSNDYETSEVKRFIEEWLKERRPEKKVEMTKEEAISRLQKMVVWKDEDIMAMRMAIKALEEKPKGQWLPVCDEKWRRYICSRCGNFEPYEFVLDGEIKNEQGQTVLTQSWDCRYCPHCGAEMGKEE